ncbi:hypothetical protein, partial [Pectinatus frisingensis]
MIKKLRPLINFCVLVAACLVISGCVNVQADFIFNKDGSITGQHTIEFSSMVDKNKLEDQKENDRKDGYEIKD